MSGARGNCKTGTSGGAYSFSPPVSCSGLRSLSHDGPDVLPVVCCVSRFTQVSRLTKQVLPMSQYGGFNRRRFTQRQRSLPSQCRVVTLDILLLGGRLPRFVCQTCQRMLATQPNSLGRRETFAANIRFNCKLLLRAVECLLAGSSHQ